MKKRLILSRVVAIIAFLAYMVSLLFPYKLYVDTSIDGQITYSPSSIGYNSEYILFFVFFIPALVFILVRHTLVMKVFTTIVCFALFGISCVALSEDFSSEYSKPHVGFYLFFLGAFLFFLVAIYKLFIPVPIKKPKNSNLLDDF